MVNIFKKIANLINGIKEEPQHAGKKYRNHQAEKATRKTGTIGQTDRRRVTEVMAEQSVASNNLPGHNSIEKQGNIINAIVAKLQSNYRGRQVSMIDKLLIVYILDNILYDSIPVNEFRQTLESAISDELGLIFSRIEIKSGSKFLDVDYTKLFSEVYIGIKPIQRTRTIRKAVVTPIKNCGSTLDPEYYLDSEQIATFPGSRYNIGAGKHPLMDDGSHRINYIAIDDNPASDEFDKNKYVSRAHANITFSDEFGFMLNVELGGSYMAKKRTQIQRGNDKIDICSVHIPVPLRNGDYIILSKYVHLLFKEA